MNPIPEKKIVDRLFHAGLLIKGVSGLFELGSGIASFFLTTNEVLYATRMVVEGKLAADPDNAIANYILDMASQWNPGQTNVFLFLYLAVHGVINLTLVTLLLAKKMWAYPLSLAIFGIFVAAEIWQIYFNHSPLLAAFTVFDLVVIGLIVQEYRYMHRKRRRTA